jgi:hypothetical protein
MLDLPARYAQEVPQRVTGRSVDWALSFGVMGTLTALGATLPSLFLAFPFQAYHLALAALAGATALALGATLPGVLDVLRRRVRLRWLVAGALAIGGAWGALVSGLAAALTTPALEIGTVERMWAYPLETGGLVAAGALVGALQVSWFWLGHAVQTALRGRRWPLLAAAAALAPILGWIAGQLV